MKLTKKNILIVALAVCLLALISVGTLAWFTDSDEVTNNFMIADSDDDADGIFSVDVWEKDNGGKEYGKGDDPTPGITYPDILPGDNLYKEVNIENTGYYDQYIRATVTVSDAHVWQEIFGTIYVPLNAIATDLNTKYDVYSIVYDAAADTLTYVLYYSEVLGDDEDLSTLFTNIHIPEKMDRFQAAEMSGGFSVKVFAEAVQTANVGNNAVDAFAKVNMSVEAGNHVTNLTSESAANLLAFLEEHEDAVITLDLTGITLDIAFFNGANLTIIGGTINASDLANNGTLTLIGTTVNGDVLNAGTMTVTNGSIVADEIINAGDLTLTDTDVDADVTNNGTMTVTNGSIVGGDIINNGTMTLTGTVVEANVTNNDSLTVDGSVIIATEINNGNRARPGRPDPQPAAKGFVTNNGAMSVTDGVVNADEFTNNGDLTMTGTAVNGEVPATYARPGRPDPDRPDPDRPDPKPEENDANVTNNGTMTLADCAVEADALVNKGTLTVTNGTVVADELTNDGALTLTDVALEAVIANNGTMTATNGTVETSEFKNSGDLTLTGTAIDSSNNAYAVYSYGTAIFTDVDVNSAAGGIYVEGAATFNGGEIDLDSDKNSQLNVFEVSGRGSKLVINGGEFSFNTKKQRTYVDAGSDTTVEINDGTFGAASSVRNCKAISEGRNASVTIKGGTFGFDPSEWVARNYRASKSYSYADRAWIWTVKKYK